MNPGYLTNLQSLLDNAIPDLPRTHELQFKSVFGAVAGYVDGRIFVSFGNFGFALKLPPERCAGLIEDSSAVPLRYFPNGHIKKSYAVLPERIVQDALQLQNLVEESIAYVLALRSSAKRNTR